MIHNNSILIDIKQQIVQFTVFSLDIILKMYTRGSMRNIEKFHQNIGNVINILINRWEKI